VRVIAGEAKGVRLGPVPRGVRPVSDRVREGVFSSLGSVEGDRVLDLFAGTGAMGIEALSRGAGHARFVDEARTSVRAIRDNLTRTHLVDRAHVEQAAVVRSVISQSTDGTQAYDLVVLDPPYDDPAQQVEQVLERLSGGLLAGGGRCVVTRATRRSEVVIPVHWGVSRRLEYGDTAVLILREA
jgi:16S rRNA (guanine966-N2)-methyltransferase